MNLTEGGERQMENRTKRFKELFDEKELMEKEHPSLKRSFSRFLEDFKEYERMRESFRTKRRTPSDYLLYGALYEEER